MNSSLAFQVGGDVAHSCEAPEIGLVYPDSQYRGRHIDPGRVDLIGNSPSMRAVYELAGRVARTDATVLITGESGTGKELLAQSVHRLSERYGPFVAVNCGAISPELIESELFGHERGSFTNAVTVHRGCFERASGGTLLLDEIGEMPLPLQVTLLRVIETASVTRVGGECAIPVRVRLVAATNRDPEELVCNGLLRPDLFYRLDVFRIHVPPLREREDDVMLLANHFLDRLNRQAGVQKRFHPGAVDRLKRYSWPGNVRELMNAIHCAFILADDQITCEDLPIEPNGKHARDEGMALISPAGHLRSSGDLIGIRVGMTMDEATRQLILATLQHCRGDKKRTAQMLGISRKTIYNCLKRYRSPDSRAT